MCADKGGLYISGCRPVVKTEGRVNTRYHLHILPAGTPRLPCGSPQGVFPCVPRGGMRFEDKGGERRGKGGEVVNE